MEPASYPSRASPGTTSPLVSLLSLSVNPDIVVRLIATGLAAGILLDVVVVRTLLVPGLVALMGKWNWWMPTGLARLLRVVPSRAAPSPGGA
jgi:putative drug exporter of the RND superfamily